MLNKAILMGRLTREVELRYTSTNNVPVASFTLAVERRFSKTGEADFINVTAWDKAADFCSKYFNKGQKVSVVGRMQTSSFDDADGNKRFKTEVVAEEVYFAESKKDTENNKNNDGGEDNPFVEVDEEEDSLPFS